MKRVISISSEPKDAAQIASMENINNSMEKWREYELLQGKIDLLKAITEEITDDNSETDWVACKIAKILLYGVQPMKEELNAIWQNMGVVSGFVGAIALSVMLNPLEKSDGFEGQNGSGFSEGIARAYYIFWTVAAITEIMTLLILLIILTHFTYTVRDVDIFRFVVNWKGVTDLTEVLTTLGCYSMMIGSATGMFIICDSVVAVTTFAVTFVAAVIIMWNWCTMLSRNACMRRESSYKIINSFKELHLKTELFKQ